MVREFDRQTDAAAAVAAVVAVPATAAVAAVAETAVVAAVAAVDTDAVVLVVRAPFVLVDGDANVVVVVVVVVVAVVVVVVVVVAVVGGGGVDLPGCGRPPHAAHSSGSHTQTGRR